MIRTFYGLDTLNSGTAFFAALAVGFFFGLALERAGFGSSRRLAGVFYFRDMAVLKVMFTAVITAMLGLGLFAALDLIDLSTQVYFMKTYYGTYAVGGLIFGIGFVMSGWCPGTAAVGLASGKIDALIFLIGGLIGSGVFNEVFPFIQPFYTWGQSLQETYGEPGLAFVYTTLGLSKGLFALLFTLVAVLCFWGAEYIERVYRKTGLYLDSPFLKAFSLGLIVFAAALLLIPSQGPEATVKDVAADESRPALGPATEKELLTAVASAEDHIEPEELADRLSGGEAGLLVIDVRPAEEYHAFHIRGALNIQLSDLPTFLQDHQAAGLIVLYSNGMTHPAQARDALFRLGYRNVYILTDGLVGFVERCLKPVSLRPEPTPTADAERVHAWRRYFVQGQD